MDPIFSQHAQTALAIESRDRLDRLATFTPDQMAQGLMWLSGYAPGIFDAVLNAVEPCLDDEPDGADEPEPFCGVCGADIGIFLRFGLDWRHFRGDGTTIGRIEIFDAGHAPVVAWRPARATTAR